VYYFSFDAPLKREMFDNRAVEGFIDTLSGGGGQSLDKEQLRDLFNTVDTDRSGAINQSEYLRFMGNINAGMSLTEAAELWDDLDSDASRSLDFEELYAWYASDKQGVSEPLEAAIPLPISGQSS